MFFYSIGIKFYIFFIYLASVFNQKALKAISGRKNFFKINIPVPSQKYIWFHCASLGEFEQCRPIIEKIKDQNPEKKILLSFFSPSGFELIKDYPLADKVVYLPFDSPSNANKFLNFFQIEMAIFVKYDVWPYYLKEILKRKIPVFLTSAVFRKEHFFFKWYGQFFLKILAQMNKIFVQNEESVLLGKKNGLNNIERSGDVRVDRVLDIQSNVQEIPLVKQFIGEKKCIVFGSVYETEIPIIKYVQENLKDEFKMIIAPHNIDQITLNNFNNKFPKTVLYADLEKNNNSNILLIDHIGSLNRIYQYANMVYVGGGFNKGIHNILEPAVFNVPVFIGPLHHKFPEVSSLLRENLVFVNNTPLEVAKDMVAKLKENKPEHFILNSQEWFKNNTGATSLIYSSLSSYF